MKNIVINKNMTKFILLIIISFASLQCFLKPTKNADYHFPVIIADSAKITQIEFDSIAIDFYNNYQNDTIKTVESCVKLCRIWNTLAHYKYEIRGSYTPMIYKILISQESICYEILELEGIRYGGYSKKHNIFLRHITTNSNSVYFITDFGKNK